MVLKSKKVLALFAAIVMCAALCPAIAHAAQLATGTASAADSPKTAVHTQATKTVYVITKITETTSSPGWPAYVSEYAFAYNKSKLVKSCKDWVLKWSYGKNNGIKSIIKRGSEECDYHYNLDKNGRQTYLSQEEADSGTGYKPKYNKAGRIVSVKGSSTEYEDDSSYSWKTTYSYKNGLRVKEGDTRYTYDKRKNLVKYAGYYESIAFKNTYKNGRLVKRTYTRGEGESMSTVTIKYSYKRVKVQKNLVKKVKAQQWALRNDNLNDALGFAVSINSLAHDYAYIW